MDPFIFTNQAEVNNPVLDAVAAGLNKLVRQMALARLVEELELEGRHYIPGNEIMAMRLGQLEDECAEELHIRRYHITEDNSVILEFESGNRLLLTPPKE